MENRPPGPDDDTFSKDDDNESEDKRSREAPVQRRVPMRSLREIIGGAPERVPEVKKRDNNILSVLGRSAEKPEIATSDQSSTETVKAAPIAAEVAAKQADQMNRSKIELSDDDEENEEENSDEKSEENRKSKAADPESSEVATVADSAESHPVDSQSDEEARELLSQLEGGDFAASNIDIPHESSLDEIQNYVELYGAEDSSYASLAEATIPSPRTSEEYISSVKLPTIDSDITFDAAVPESDPTEGAEPATASSGGEGLPPSTDTLPSDSMPPIDGGVTTARSFSAESFAPVAASVARSTESAVSPHSHGHAVDGLLAVGLVAEHFVAKNRNEKTKRELHGQINNLREQAEQEQANIRKMQTNALGQQEQLTAMQLEHVQQVVNAQKTQEQMRNDLQDLEQRQAVNIDAHANIYPSLHTEAEVNVDSANITAAEVSAFSQGTANVEQSSVTNQYNTEKVSAFSSDVQPFPKPDLRTNIAGSPELSVAPAEVVADSKRIEKEVDVQKQEVLQMAMEQSKVAAEHGIPVEKNYERRSEVRDDQDFSGGNGGGGGILPDTETGSGSVDTFNRRTEFSSYDNAYQKNDEPNSAYHSAVVGGFAGAMVVLVIALIAYFLLR